MIPVTHVTWSVLVSILQAQPLSPAKVVFAWQAAAGPALARAADPRLQADGTLEIRASSPHWRREIERSRALLLDRVRALLGNETVRQIVVRSV
jgi:hypothetical protein